MNEQQWFGATDPQQMLEWLRRLARPSERKLRLFACACCRRILEDKTHPLVLVSEAVADGLAEKGKLRAARRTVGAVGSYSSMASMANAVAATVEEGAATAAQSTSTHAANYFGHIGVERAGFEPDAWKVIFPARREAEQAVQAGLLRDQFGNPYSPLARLDPVLLAWNGGTVGQLARTAYDERILPEGHLDPARLAVLADALEEAGCTTQELLAHLRSPGPHVRGCHAIDAVLGRD